MISKCEQPSLELFDVLHGSEDNMLLFAEVQKQNFDKLVAMSSQLDTTIYLLRAKIKNTHLANERAKWLKNRKVNAVALCEFRDPARMREETNFQVNYEDEDIYDAEFYKESEITLKKSGYDPNVLFQLAEERRQEFDERLQNENKTELGAQDGLTESIRAFLTEAKQKIYNNDVFSACYINKVGIEEERADYNDEMFYSEECEELNEQADILHHLLNDMRALKLNLEHEEMNLTSKLEFQKDLKRHILITTNKQRILSEQKREVRRRLIESQFHREAKTPQYPKPWRDIRPSDSTQLLEVERLRRLIKESGLCGKKLALDYECAHRNPIFENYKSYQWKRLAHFLVTSTEFIVDLHWMMDLLEKSDASLKDNMPLIFITE